MAGIEDVQRAINAVMAERGLTRSRMAAAMQVDPGTLGDLLDGRRTPKAPTQGKVERYFGWPPGTVAEVLAGRGRLPATNAPGETIEVRDSSGIRWAEPGETLLQFAQPRSRAELRALLEVLRAQEAELTNEWAELQVQQHQLAEDLAALTSQRVRIQKDITGTEDLLAALDAARDQEAPEPATEHLEDPRRAAELVLLRELDDNVTLGELRQTAATIAADPTGPGVAVPQHDVPHDAFGLAARKGQIEEPGD